MKIKAKAALTAAAFSAAAVMSFSGCENEIPEATYGPPPDLEYNNTVTETSVTEISDTEWTSDGETVSRNGSESDADISEEDSDEDDFDDDDFDPDYNMLPTVYGPPM